MSNLTPLLYGSFNLNDGINYFVRRKMIDMASVNPSMFKIGRLEGMKKVGENVNDKQFQVEVVILGVSRADLESKVDALHQALWLRNQKLSVRTNDDRFYYADCIGCKADLQQGQILTTTATCLFNAYIPYAQSSSAQTLDTSTVQMVAQGTPGLGSGIFTYTQSITGGGTVYSRPTIRIYQRTPAATGTYNGPQMNIGQIYTSLAVAATTQGLNQYDNLILSQSGHTQIIQVAGFTPAGSTTIQTGGFAANYTYSNNATWTRDLTWQTLQINQTLDQQAIQIVNQMPTITGDYLEINCDPTNAATGFTAQKNSSGVLATINGVFPVQQPVSTAWTITIVANSVPFIEAVWTWTPRWLS